MMYKTSITTPLGTFQLTCSNEGLTRIIFPGRELSSLFNVPDNSTTAPAFLADAARQIREYCEGQRYIFSLPLSPQGTPFQLKVWEVIQAITYGQTMSYGEIAKKLGNRNKARAVGGAANANPLPLVIPCHRVVGSDGSLTGFAGGIQLKQTLLKMEQTAFL